MWLTASGKSITEMPEDAGAFFHVFFYGFAPAELLGWARRRRAHLYASFTSALAIFLGLLGSCLMGAFHLITTVIALITALILWLHFYRELQIHKQTLSAWIRTMGANKLTELGRARPGEQVAQNVMSLD
jgi:hypothetical protein